MIEKVLLNILLLTIILIPKLNSQKMGIEVSILNASFFESSENVVLSNFDFKLELQYDIVKKSKYSVPISIGYMNLNVNSINCYNTPEVNIKRSDLLNWKMIYTNLNIQAKFRSTNLNLIFGHSRRVEYTYDQTYQTIRGFAILTYPILKPNRFHLGIGGGYEVLSNDQLSIKLIANSIIDLERLKGGNGYHIFDLGLNISKVIK